MHRTQIYIPKAQWKTLQTIAQKEERSTSQMIRELIDFGLRHGKGKIRVEKPTADLLSIAKKVNAVKGEKAPKDLASRMDEYLYGQNE